MTEAIKELTINDHIYRAKGTYLFGKTAKQYTQNEVDDKGKEQKSDGVTSIIMSLMKKDADKLIEFWHCATSHYGKHAPTLDDVAQAISVRAKDEKTGLKP